MAHGRSGINCGRRHRRRQQHGAAADEGMGLAGAVRGRAWVTTTQPDLVVTRPHDLVVDAQSVGVHRRDDWRLKEWAKYP
jgi:hypothetical protein